MTHDPRQRPTYPSSDSPLPHTPRLTTYALPYFLLYCFYMNGESSSSASRKILIVLALLLFIVALVLVILQSTMFKQGTKTTQAPQDVSETEAPALDPILQQYIDQAKQPPPTVTQNQHPPEVFIMPKRSAEKLEIQNPVIDIRTESSPGKAQ